MSCMRKKKATDEQLIKAYQSLKSVWKVGEAVGMSGQQVHERLKNLGIVFTNRPINNEEINRIIETYKSFSKRGDVDLKSLSKELNRTPQLICRTAKKLGLTDYNRNVNDKIKKDISNRSKEWIAKNGHPKGATGIVHKNETKKILSQNSIKMWKDIHKNDERFSNWVMKGLKTRFKKGTLYRRGVEKRSWKAAWREIGGKRKYYRSRWEANFARILEMQKQEGLIKDWFHEPDTFWFDGIMRGTRSFLPDFKIIRHDDTFFYIEVKGWMDERSKTKIKRMKKYHPGIYLVIVDSTKYKELESKYAWFIKDWE